MPKRQASMIRSHAHHQSIHAVHGWAEGEGKGEVKGLSSRALGGEGVRYGRRGGRKDGDKGGVRV